MRTHTCTIFGLAMFIDECFVFSWKRLAKVLLLPILRCIRPPQSLSGTNKFLKTLVCADLSEHLHETNRINSFYTILFWIFFFFGGGAIFIFVRLFGDVCKPCFWNFVIKNFLVMRIFGYFTVSNNFFF